MSYKRPNPGRREREARKRHRRARVSSGTECGWLKLGQEHFRRWCREHLRHWIFPPMCVADSRKRVKETAKEPARQPIRFKS